MKIIKKSAKIKKREEVESKPWSIRVKCTGDDVLKTNGCGSTVEVSEEDLKLFYWHGTHFPHRYLCAKCPACGEILQSLKPKVPEYVCNRWYKKHPRTKPEFDGFSESIYD